MAERVRISVHKYDGAARLPPKCSGTFYQWCVVVDGEVLCRCGKYGGRARARYIARSLRRDPRLLDLLLSTMLSDDTYCPERIVTALVRALGPTTRAPASEKKPDAHYMHHALIDRDAGG